MNSNQNKNYKKNIKIGYYLAIVSFIFSVIFSLSSLMIFFLFQAGFGGMGLVLLIFVLFFVLISYQLYLGVINIKNNNLKVAFNKILIFNLISVLFFGGFLIGPFFGFLSLFFIYKK